MPEQIRIIAGLGNPEPQHERTLHNAGFWFVDALARKFGGDFRYDKKFDADVCRISVRGHDIWLVKPQSYMNCSGGPIRAALDYYRLEVSELLVAHDEIDLQPGITRLKEGGGHGGHNGLRDVFRHLGDPGFLRLRIGIGHPGSKDAVTPYVLSRATAGEERQIRDSIADAILVLPKVLEGDIPGAMKDLHTVRDDGI